MVDFFVPLKRFGRFKKICPGGEEGLDWGQLKALYGEMLVPDKIQDIIKARDITDDGIDSLTLEEFRNFLKNDQKQSTEWFKIRNTHKFCFRKL